MPNNNPAGRNQYTKRKEEFAQTANAQSGDSQHEHDAAAHASEPGSIITGGSSAPAKRGFAAMDEATQRGIASKGGQSQGKENNPGNFANDRDRAREAGRKGGEAHGTHRADHSPTNH